MQCEICHSELSPEDLACKECGTPVLQNVEGFENSMAIQRILRTLIVDNFKNAPVNTRSLVALLKDYLTEYKSECRLLIYTINSGVLRNMISEENRNIAIMSVQITDVRLDDLDAR